MIEDFDDIKLTGDNELNEPIPFDDDSNETIPSDDETGQTSVSHSPLNLGGSDIKEAPKPAPRKQTDNTSSAERITGVKTFFTKLHPGAINFLDEQITDWLKENPSINIKKTNITTGEVQAKKTEPNIIITVWY
jgi:hypothetical protein